MRWFPFAILMIAVLTLQTVFAHRLDVFGARPDWLLVTVVFLAFHAPRRDAVIGAWIMGACADLMTIERFGVIALAYCLTAFAIVSIRDTLFRHRFATQFIVTFLACVLVRTGWTAYRCTLYELEGSLFRDLGIDVLGVSLYTAVWAPLGHSLLQRVGTWLGFRMPRHRQSGVRRRKPQHV